MYKNLVHRPNDVTEFELSQLDQRRKREKQLILDLDVQEEEGKEGEEEDSDSDDKIEYDGIISEAKGSNSRKKKQVNDLAAKLGIDVMEGDY